MLFDRAIAGGLNQIGNSGWMKRAVVASLVLGAATRGEP